jgi:hypothetical protein
MVTTDIVNYVRTYNGPHPKGCHCRFYKIDDMWGAKVYNTQDDRDFAYRKQAEAAIWGLAPEVGDKFEVDGEKWCYLTEVAECIVPYTGEQFTETWYNTAEKVRKGRPQLIQEIDDFSNMMAKKGLQAGDDHLGNFGFLRGKLVRIDFGW